MLFCKVSQIVPFDKCISDSRQLEFFQKANFEKKMLMFLSEYICQAFKQTSYR